MIYLCGKTVCGGISFGTAYILKRNIGSDIKHTATDNADQLKRLEQAVFTVKQGLALCAEKTESETAKEIFEVHAMMLEDQDVLDFLRNSVINDGKTATDAVILTENYFSQMFRDTQDDHMIARIDDIRDVCGSLLAYLSENEFLYKPQEPFVLVADELLPSDLIKYAGENLIGIVMGSGTVYSHTSILIKEMGIPALICDGIDGANNGMCVLLDADGGKVFFEPDSRTKEEFRRKIASRGSKKSVFSSENLPYKVYVNIGDPKEVSDEIIEKCDGIGLFRTEYLYFGKNDLPTEEEQFAIYKEILEKAKGKPVTVRTFDIGSDKSAKALPLKTEENPALGFRGLRVYSLYGDVFKTQIRALLRAAVYGNLNIMYPMVTSCNEIENIKSTVLKAANELSKQGIEYKIPLQGAMIETPAAALLSGELAKTVDFFSVGTNDLTQYTYALDRGALSLAPFYDESCNAVLSLIEIATCNAHKNGIKIGICGELAGDLDFTGKWDKLGIDYISVSRSFFNR